MNQAKDSTKRETIKRETIKYLIRFISIVIFALFIVNAVLFGVFCYVERVQKKDPIEIKLIDTPLKGVLESLDITASIISNESLNRPEFQPLEIEPLLRMLAESDDKMIDVDYIPMDTVNNLEKRSVSFVEISGPIANQDQKPKSLKIMRSVIDHNSDNLGTLIVEYPYDAFENTLMGSLLNLSSRSRLVYDENQNEIENAVYTIKETHYKIIEENQYQAILMSFLKRELSIIGLMCIILLSAAYIIVNRSIKTLGNLITDLDRNYRKNTTGSCLIDEYHLIISRFEDLKLDINLKLLKISELKVVESDLIQELRYKTKQFEELYKNHAVLKNRAQYLSAFFSTVSDNMDQIIWLTDTSGRIVYANQALKEILKFEVSNNQECHLKDFIEGFDQGMDILLSRDFKAIKFTFKNQVFNEPLSGSAIRISEFNKVKFILFLCSKSNFEDKMNQNYLKKSRDLHFINEIGKIISINNNIEATLQEVLDKVAFLANLNSSTIRLVNENQMLEIKTVSGYSTEYVLNEETPIDDHHMGYCFKENKIILINHEEDLLFPEPFLQKILNEGKSIAYIPLANYQKSFGVMSIISDFKFNTDYLVLLESISINVTISLEKVLLYDQLKANYFKTVEAFVTAAEIKQERFSGHSRRVARVCRLIAQRLYLNENEIDDIYIAGLLHDIGKLGFADNSLEYFFDIDDHGAMGRKMIENVGFNKEILDGIEFHHLNYDLSNQSNELQEQPYYSQIIRLANDFDLFMNYRSGELNRQQFITKMSSDSGTVYSPQLIKILEDLMESKSEVLQDIYESAIQGEKYEN